MPTASRRERARVAARLGVTASLAVVPDRAVRWLRDAYASSSGGRRRALEPVVALARHRRLPAAESFTLYDRGDLTLVTTDSQIAKRLFWYGEHGYEGREVDWWRRFCRQAEAVLEIGANIGYYTVQGAAAAAPRPYVAVEAHPESAAIARRNVALNRLLNVTIVQAAVTGPGAGPVATLAIPDLERYAAPTGAFLSVGTEAVGARRPAHTSVTVPAVETHEVLGDADLLKLDVEGLEHEVLRPVLGLLVARRATLFLELLRATPQLRQLLAELVDEGYRLLVITHGGELEELSAADLPDVDLLERYGSRDLIAVHRSRTLPPADT